jgi:hypothetical protein
LESGAPILAYWRIPIGCCFGRPLVKVQCQLISIKIGIGRGATPFNMSTVYIKQNVNIEKSQELMGRSEKFKSR